MITAKTLNHLSLLIGNWANLNFKVHNPQLGIIEEIGESAHCLLKRHQAVRGLDDPSIFKAKFADALADIAIYALHFCSINQIEFQFDIADSGPIDPTHNAIVGEMAIAAGTLLLGFQKDVDTGLVIEIFQGLCWLAKVEQIELEKVILDTWNHTVSKRNWVTDPLDGDMSHGKEVQL